MYYIYILKNPITGLPFYVGVGKRDRKKTGPREKSHIGEALNFKNGKVGKHTNKHKLNTILQILDSGKEVDIEIGNRYEDEKLAFDEEIRLIAYYGRRDLGTGILTNMTDGGEGNMNPSIESRKKRSEKRKGIPSGKKGKKIGPYSEERKQSLREKMRKKKQELSEDEKKAQHLNRSKVNKGKTPWNKGLTKEDPRVLSYAKKKIEYWSNKKAQEA